MKTTAEKIEVMQAFERGEEIQVECGNSWARVSDPKWNWDAFDYRIKPKAREFWITPHEPSPNVAARLAIDHDPGQPGYIHVREVCDD